MHKCIDQGLIELFDAECDDDVSIELLERGHNDTAALAAAKNAKAPERLRKMFMKLPKPLVKKRLEDFAIAFYKRKARFRWQVLTPNEYSAFAIPAKKSEDQVQGLGGWLRLASVREEKAELGSSLISDNLAVAWRCEVCQHTFRFNRAEMVRHKAECVGEGDGAPLPPQNLGSSVPLQVEQPANLLGSQLSRSLPHADSQTMQQDVNAESSPATSEWVLPVHPALQGPVWICEECGHTIPKGETLLILKHKRSHGI